jgi:DNA-binding LytR/AlgR family response regulator
MSNEVLAFGVTLASFVIAGAFLLTGVTFRASVPQPVIAASPVPPLPADATVPRVPYEKEGRIHFAAASDIAAIRAEGRYTYLYCRSEKVFSPWSISEADKRLTGVGFHRCHRSYVVNADFVSSFERKKDTGILYFEGVTSLDKAPVSRSHLPDIRKALGV